MPDSMEYRFYRYCRQYRINIRRNRRRDALRNKTVSNAISLDRCESSTSSRESRSHRNILADFSKWNFATRPPLYLIRSPCSASSDEKWSGPGFVCFARASKPSRSETRSCSRAATHASDRALISAEERLVS